MNTLLIAGYILLGVFFSRWPVGVFLNSETFWNDPSDRLMAGLIGLGSAIFWPIVAVCVIAYGAGALVYRSPVGHVLATGIKWFYTLDRDARKELLR